MTQEALYQEHMALPRACTIALSDVGAFEHSSSTIVLTRRFMCRKMSRANKHPFRSLAVLARALSR